MKRNILFSIIAFCLIGACMLFAGCGEQFIVEKTYKLAEMQIIKDNTPSDGGYSHYPAGTFTEFLTGNMSCEDCTVEVGRQSTKLIYDTTDENGFYATYTFSVYTADDVYPAYNLSSIEVKHDGEVIDLDDYTPEAEDQFIFDNLKQFSYVLEYGDTSIQLVTQNKTFGAQIIMLDKTSGDLLLLAMLYGY